MLGLIRKKKLAEALKVIAHEHESYENVPDGYDKSNWMFYCFGNMNCVNFIGHRFGIDRSEKKK